MGGRSTVQYYGYSAIEGKPETENYEKDNLPVRYSISDERYIDYTYDSLNRLIGKTLSLASPLSYAYTYKASDRGGNYTTSLIATETIGGDVYSYTYDKLGNITSISLNGEEIRSFVYDRYNQLKRDNNKLANLTYYYNYDGYGNLTDKRTYEYTTGDLGTRLSKTNYAYSGDTAAGWSKALTGFGNETITYDEIGNPVSYRGATLDWNERQLKSYDKGNTSVTYKYDSDGLRASKTVNGEKTTYQYVSGKLMYENRNGTDIYYYYDSLGTPTSIKYYEPDGTNYRFYLATNQQGDVIGLYNTSGNLVVKYEYDAWGNIISETNATGGTPTSLAQYWSDINPFRYRGYYYDAETGLYYLQNRYYDAEVGRFINSDVLLDRSDLLGFNPFAYCLNNPNVYWDPEGTFPWVLVALGLFALGGFIIGVNSDTKLWENTSAKKDSGIGVPKHSCNATSNIDITQSQNTSLKNNQPSNKQSSTKVDKSKSNNGASFEKDEISLSVGDKLINGLIGMSMGLFVGGATICTAGVIGTVAYGTSAVIPIFGLTAPQTAAIGAVAFNVVAMVVLPALGITTVEPIEFVQ